jgi:putative ABC transport system permease protein
MIAYITTAFQSIWHNKIRSLLTVLGVVIGVSSVTTLVSLGQGLKNDVAALIQGFGTNVVTIVAGNIDTEGQSQVNPANFVSGEVLTLADVEEIASLPDVKVVTPIGLTAGGVSYSDKQATPVIFGAYPNVLEAFEVLVLGKGRMFPDTSGDFAVIGPETVEILFGDQDPVGKKITIRTREITKELIIIGTLEEAKSASIFGSEFSNLIIIPFETSVEINSGKTNINRIVIKAQEDTDVNTLKGQVNTLMLENHGGEDDFTILTQDDLLDLFNEFLNLSTTLVSAIAAISLIVGGIGIMNIMLVTVTERTREIGLRKAVGATKLAILFQFLVEAIVITSLGGVIGIGFSLVVGMIVASQTPLKPDITVEVFLMAIGVSMITGIVFGLWPALKAANKDPIEALRYE